MNIFIVVFRIVTNTDQWWYYQKLLWVALTLYNYLVNTSKVVDEGGGRNIVMYPSSTVYSTRVLQVPGDYGYLLRRGSTLKFTIQHQYKIQPAMVFSLPPVEFSIMYVYILSEAHWVVGPLVEELFVWLPLGDSVHWNSTI